tara:strand:- start:11942 stop:13258 length:1317 start_codon:yes stop_codon:yes gene_type:complete
MKLTELMAKKQELAAEIRKQADTEGAFDEARQAAWDQVNKDYDANSAAIDIAHRAAEVEKDSIEVRDARIDALKDAGIQVSGDQLEAEKVSAIELESRSINGFIRRSFGFDTSKEQDEAMAQSDIAKNHGQFGDIGYRMAKKRINQRHVGSAFEQRAQATAPDSAGGFLIAEGFIAELERQMLYFGPMANIARNLRTNKGNRLPWPTNNDTGNTGSLVAENAAPSETDLVFGEVALNAFKYTSDLVKVSEELMEDSEFDMASLLAEALGERIGRITNTELTTGSGSGECQGVITGTTTTSAAALAPTGDELIDLQHSVDIAYRPGSTFLAHDLTIKGFRQLKDDDGQYIWQTGLQAGQPDMLLGQPLLANNDMDQVGTGNDTVLFGNFSKFIHRQVRDMRFYRLNELYRGNDQTGFVSFFRQDSRVLQPAAFAKIVQA